MHAEDPTQAPEARTAHREAAAPAKARGAQRAGAKTRTARTAPARASTGPAQALSGEPGAKPAALEVPRETCVLAEQRTNRWFGTAPRGCTPEQLDMDPAPWVSVAGSFTRFDEIRLVASDLTWIAEYVVLQSGPRGSTFAVCKLLRVVEIPVISSERSGLPAGYSIVPDWDPSSGTTWVVRRDKDGVVLNHGSFHRTEEEARRFLLDHPVVRGEVRATIWGG